PGKGVARIDGWISRSTARFKKTLFLMSTFAALALFLARLGISGVTDFLVKQRVQEFGIRMFFQAEDGIRYKLVTGVQTCALPISRTPGPSPGFSPPRSRIPAFAAAGCAGSGSPSGGRDGQATAPPPHAADPPRDA